jgi:hypothetical protein
VLSGTVYLGAGDKLDPAKTTAMARARCSSCRPRCTNVTELWGAIYLNPADDPRKK